MKRLFESANRYVKDRDWTDLVLLKFCLLAAGVMAGIAIPTRWKKPAVLVAVGAFAATYIPLILKFLSFLQSADEQEDE